MDLKNKKILVTGADGFLGSHLVEKLLSVGSSVKALSQYNSFNYWGWLEGKSHEKLQVISGDIRDPFFCRELTQDVEVIFHLAALIAIPYSYKAPSSYIETNINGTLNICQAAITNNVQKIVHISTSEVYGTADYVPIDEAHPLKPQSPYSASKIGADAIAMSFFNSFDLPLTIARPFNIYGPRQSARAFIPNIISQINSGSGIVKVGDLSPTRDLTFVEDTCKGLLAVAESGLTIGEVINIGSNYEISMLDTLNLIKEIMGRNINVVVDKQRIRPEKSEVNRLWCDNSKLIKTTNFVPSIDISTGLKKTIKWFNESKNQEKYKTNIYNI